MKKITTLFALLFCLLAYQTAQAQTMEFYNKIKGLITIEFVEGTPQYERPPSLKNEKGNIYLGTAGNCKVKINNKLQDCFAITFQNESDPLVSIVIISGNKKYIIDADGLQLIEPNDAVWLYKRNAIDKD